MAENSALTISAPPFDRGCAIGLARHGPIRACLSDWLGSLSAAGIDDPHSYLRKFLGETSFLTSVGDYAPDLLAEVRGMARGSEQPFELMFAAQLMDEEWSYRSTAVGRPASAEKCSSVAVLNDAGEAIIGQNMDLGGFTDGHQTISRFSDRPGDTESFIFSISSMIALMGVNSSGVGVCVNSLAQLPSRPSGVPVAFVIRKLLRAHTLTEAVEIVGSVPHATGQHYLLCDAYRICSFEASPDGVVCYTPTNPAKVVHTNHPLTPSSAQLSGTANSLARLSCLESRFAQGFIGIKEVKATLASRDDPDNPVSRTADPSASPSELTGMVGFTTGSMISRLRRVSREIDVWVSLGPPSERAYEHHTIPQKE